MRDLYLGIKKYDGTGLRFLWVEEMIILWKLPAALSILPAKALCYVRPSCKRLPDRTCQLSNMRFVPTP